MAENSDYDVLIITSWHEHIDRLAEIGQRNFSNVAVVYWEIGNLSTKPDALREIERTDYNLLVSYINGLILKPHHLERAHYGAINIHPAPPEHPGLFGFLCQPVICRSVRTHHGVTVHEMDEEIDHGPIYRVRRWEVDEDATIQSVLDRSVAECLEIFEEVAEELGRSTNGTRCFPRTEEAWHATNCHHSIEDVRRWFEALDPAHPAHQERVIFNHPRATYSPPYFDDV
jgi:methionyl-tRNA formyltransferase